MQATAEPQEKTGHVPEPPDGVATTKAEAKAIKRGRGRPPKPFVSELPKPKRFELKSDDFFEYLRNIPQDKLERLTLALYRYLPIVDYTEGGTKDKGMDKIPGESHPFKDPDWEGQMLHRYGSGRYGCYLNEMNRTICRCLDIQTRWDLDNYPPVVPIEWVDQNHPQNRAYIQYLRSRGVNLPSEKDKETEENEMQLAETVSKLTDTVIQQANRMNVPVPQITRESNAEKLTLEAAKATIDMVKEQASSLANTRNDQSNPLELVDKVVSVADRITGGGKNSGDDTLKMFLQDALKRAQDERAATNALQHEFLQALREQNNKPAPTPRGLMEQLEDMAKMRTLMKEAFGINGGAEGDEEGDKKTSNAESIVTTIVQAIPTMLQQGVGLWGQFNQSIALRNRHMELEQLAKTGQLPPGATPPQPPVAPEQNAPQQNGAQRNQELNPATGQPLTTAEQETIAEERRKYAAYHGLIGTIAQPLITHLNDPGQMIDGQFTRKDGYDFADWFISGQGRLAYDQVKTLGPDTLLGAIRSYQPLWAQIGGMEDKVKQFIGEFLTFDEIQVEEGDDEKEEVSA